MSHFYGVLQGNRGEATRCGTQGSGITTAAASWSGCIETRLFVGDDGKDQYEVRMRPWHGSGDSILLSRGYVGDANSARDFVIDEAAKRL